MNGGFGLPTLPAADLYATIHGDLTSRAEGNEPLWTDGSMRAYALAAVAAEREWCAKLCEESHPPLDNAGVWMAARIREA